MQKISAIIIAAGLSRRMGEDKNKLLLPFGQSNLIGEVLKNILSADFEELIVVLGHESELVKTFVPLHEKIKCVHNPNFKTGMTSSIQCGVEAAKTENATMICLSDMPFIQKEDYNFLIKNFQNQVFFDKKCIVQPFFGEKKGNPIVFSAYYRAEILTHQEPEGCRSIVQKNKDFRHLIEMPSDAILKDIDDWETYEKTKN